MCTGSSGLFALRPAPPAPRPPAPAPRPSLGRRGERTLGTGPAASPLPPLPPTRHPPSRPAPRPPSSPAAKLPPRRRLGLSAAQQLCLLVVGKGLLAALQLWERRVLWVGPVLCLCGRGMEAHSNRWTLDWRLGQS